MVDCTRVWRWQLDVAGAHLYVGGSWMWFATRVYCAMADGRGWHPRVRRWQLEVVGVPVFAGATRVWLVPAFDVEGGCGSRTRVWRSQLDVVGAHGYGGDSLMYLVLTCVAMVIGCDWYPRVWL